MKKFILLALLIAPFVWCQASVISTNTDAAIAVSDTVPFFVPNAFTPNSDGFNERFTIKYEKTPEETFETFFMMICDRYGNVLFKTYNPTAFWDGKDKNGTLCPAGVYSYVIKYKLRNNTKAEGSSKETMEVKTGNVVLIR